MSEGYARDVALTLGFITDLHFGPVAYHDGKLRKLTGSAAELTRRVVHAMNEELRPDLLVNLGDDIEDESRDADLARYTECQDILRTAKAELVNVAGNHDMIHLTRDDLSRIWQRDGRPLFYSLDRGGFHLVVLHTHRAQGRRRPHPPRAARVARGTISRTPALPVIVLMHHSASEQDLEDSFWFKGLAHLALVKERARAAPHPRGRAARCAPCSTGTCTGTTST